MIDLSTYPESIRPRLALWQRQGLLDRILAVCAEHHTSIEEVLAPRRPHRVSAARCAIWADLCSIIVRGRRIMTTVDIAAMFGCAPSSVQKALAGRVADEDRPRSMAEAYAALPEKARAMMTRRAAA